MKGRFLSYFLNNLFYDFEKMLKIFIINPTYPYVSECIVKIVYYSYEDGNKKFNHLFYDF